jgi:hypothetical protein
LLITSQLSVAQSVTLVPTNPANPSKGTVVFDNVTNLLKYWNGTIWIPITNAAAATGWGVSGNDIYNANAGNVGLGTSTPKATFNVATGKTVLFGADSSGTGSKFIWYPSKGAFRAGYSLSNAWNYDSVGLYSLAGGANTSAIGISSTAFGASAKATGFASSAFGYLTHAGGYYSSALGYKTLANGHYTTALGTNTSALGDYSIAMGYNTTATGNYSTTMGYNTFTNNDFATVLGRFNIDVPNSLLIVGNGGWGALVSNALVVMQNGNVGIGANSPLTKLQVEGTSYFNGNVGIGTSSPLAKLHVIGNSHLTGTSYFNGSVGIGTNNPLASLHITSSNAVNETNARYFSYGTGGTIPVFPNGTYNVGLLVDYDIVTKNSFVSAQTATTSDARIKNILGVSDNQQDLATLRCLKITDYCYKDVANWGNQTFKKVIAQQVEEIYPQAVRKQTSTIPDIYCLAEKVVYDALKKELSVTLSKNYALKVGDKVEMIHAEKGKMQAEVIAVWGNTFTVKDWHYPTDKIFVYGREVNDFRVVDYEALSMLGISAIQQLAKENEELKNKMKSYESRLETLEAFLTKSQTGK